MQNSTSYRSYSCYPKRHLKMIDGNVPMAFWRNFIIPHHASTRPPHLKTLRRRRGGWGRIPPFELALLSSDEMNHLVEEERSVDVKTHLFPGSALLPASRDPLPTLSTKWSGGGGSALQPHTLRQLLSRGGGIIRYNHKSS